MTNLDIPQYALDDPRYTRVWKKDVSLDDMFNFPNDQILDVAIGNQIVRITPKNPQIGFIDCIYRKIPKEAKKKLIVWEIKRVCDKYKISVPNIYYFSNYNRDVFAEAEFEHDLLCFNENLLYPTTTSFSVLSTIYHEITHIKDDGDLTYLEVSNQYDKIPKDFKRNLIHYFNGEFDSFESKLTKMQKDYFIQLADALYYYQPVEKNANANSLKEIKETLEVIKNSSLYSVRDEKNYNDVAKTIIGKYTRSAYTIGPKKNTIISLYSRYEKLKFHYIFLKSKLSVIDEVKEKSYVLLRDGYDEIKKITYKRFLEIEKSIINIEKELIRYADCQINSIQNNFTYEDAEKLTVIDLNI